jgi:hypothetical protein
MSPYTIRDRYRTRASFSWPDKKPTYIVVEHGEQGTRVVASYSGVGAEQSARLRAEELNAKETR